MTFHANLKRLVLLIEVGYCFKWEFDHQHEADPPRLATILLVYDWQYSEKIQVENGNVGGDAEYRVKNKSVSF